MCLVITRLTLKKASLLWVTLFHLLQDDLFYLKTAPLPRPPPLNWTSLALSGHERAAVDSFLLPSPPHPPPPTPGFSVTSCNSGMWLLETVEEFEGPQAQIKARVSTAGTCFRGDLFYYVAHPSKARNGLTLQRQFKNQKPKNTVCFIYIYLYEHLLNASSWDEP